MARKQTLIANMIDATGKDAQYDRQSKRLLSMTVILAWILKSCVKEFKDFSIEYITNNCFVGKPEVMEHALHADHVNRAEDTDDMADTDNQPAMNQFVQTMNSESSTIKEHTVHFDVRFRVMIPQKVRKGRRKPKIVEFIVDVETQKDATLVQRLYYRGIYYDARMISEQYGTEFFDEEYENIKKVISIWICPSVAKSKAGSIVKVGLKPEVICGNVKISEADVDLMDMIIVNLDDSDNPENKIIRLLSVYLSDVRTPEEKKEILEKEFGIEMTEEMEKEIREMYALSQALKDKTWQAAETKTQTRIASNMLAKNNPIPFVAEMTELSEEVVRSIAASLGEKAGVRKL